MVMFPRFAVVSTLAALFGIVAADLEVLSPGGPNLWWVAQSTNVIAWSCHSSPYSNFTILVANNNTALFPSALAVIAIQQNFDCSITITQDQANQPAGDGYIIQLANPLNNTDVYTQSQPFEVKPLGSVYPATSATPTESGLTSATGSSSGSGSASPTASKSSGASATWVSSGLVAAAAAIIGLITA